ncbi:MAG: hypothetical protein L0212_13175, partial [Acidobacteria bacterium]|nr:hypothetical protein [Acidobacteriota bacterium]
NTAATIADAFWKARALQYIARVQAQAGDAAGAALTNEQALRAAAIGWVASDADSHFGFTLSDAR